MKTFSQLMFLGTCITRCWYDNRVNNIKMISYVAEPVYILQLDFLGIDQDMSTSDDV